MLFKFLFYNKHSTIVQLKFLNFILKIQFFYLLLLDPCNIKHTPKSFSVYSLCCGMNPKSFQSFLLKSYNHLNISRNQTLHQSFYIEIESNLRKCCCQIRNQFSHIAPLFLSVFFSYVIHLHLDSPTLLCLMPFSFHSYRSLLHELNFNKL